MLVFRVSKEDFFGCDGAKPEFKVCIPLDLIKISICKVYFALPFAHLL